jgi:hypothetical protein
VTVPRAARSGSSRAAATSLAAIVAGAGACGAERPGRDDGCDPWATALVDFDPGDGAGYGADGLPGVVLGPPDGGKATQGALDVVSLGQGGTITVALGCPVGDDDGADLYVYENPFVVAGGPRVFADPAEVAVSIDGDVWVTFRCDPPVSAVAADDGLDGCAGMTPVVANADNGLVGVPDGGGDAFDLARLEERVDGEVRFVRVTDRGSGGAEPNAGFDLDAIAGAVR